MGSRVNGLGVLSMIAVLITGGWTIASATSAETIMCPPMTIDDLFPEVEPEEVSEPDDTGSEATTTTAPAPPSTTAPADTTTTSAPASGSTTAPATTSIPENTSTTVADTTSTTEAPSTTTSLAETTTTVVGTTTTTAAESTTTTTTAPPDPPCNTAFVYPMVFPLLGAGDVGSHFGAPRDEGNRHHLGNDIVAPRLQPVVAVADGTLTRIAGDTGISGYRVHIGHDDGWSSLYIHLNNDTAGTDDGAGIGIRPDLREGDRVTAGEVIGWNGDSGNAETTTPHLHFELRDPSGTSVDPQPSLEAATRVSSNQFSGPFSDVVIEEGAAPMMVVLLSRGVPAWCDEVTVACAEAPATPEQMAEWLNALVGGFALPAETADPVTEAYLARVIAWDRLRDLHAAQAGWLDEAVPDGSFSTPAAEPPEHPDELDLREAHIILGGPGRCLTLPDEERLLTRAEAADTIALLLGWTQATYCPTNSSNR